MVKLIFGLCLFTSLSFVSHTEKNTGFKNLQKTFHKYKYYEMAIHRDSITKLYNQGTVKILFSLDHRNRTIPKDLVWLSDYEYNGGDSLIGQDMLIETGRNVVIRKEKEFSAFKLDTSEIKKLYDLVTAHQKIIYFVFHPVEFEDNSDFMAYTIFPSDSLFNKINFAAAITEKMEFSMNPSPPATRNVD